MKLGSNMPPSKGVSFSKMRKFSLLFRKKIGGKPTMVPFLNWKLQGVSQSVAIFTPSSSFSSRNRITHDRSSRTDTRNSGGDERKTVEDFREMLGCIFRNKLLLLTLSSFFPPKFKDTMAKRKNWKCKPAFIFIFCWLRPSNAKMAHTRLTLYYVSIRSCGNIPLSRKRRSLHVYLHKTISPLFWRQETRRHANFIKFNYPKKSFYFCEIFKFRRWKSE